MRGMRSPGRAYRVRIVFENIANGHRYERLLGPWDRAATAKAQCTREVNYHDKRRGMPSRIVSAAVEVADNWTAV